RYTRIMRSCTGAPGHGAYSCTPVRDTRPRTRMAPEGRSSIPLAAYWSAKSTKPIYLNILSAIRAWCKPRANENARTPKKHALSACVWRQADQYSGHGQHGQPEKGQISMINHPSYMPHTGALAQVVSDAIRKSIEEQRIVLLEHSDDLESALREECEGE